MTMILTFGALTVTFGNRFTSPFTQTNYPRQRIDLPAFSRSFAGSVIGESIPYESPHTWTVGVRLKLDDADKLKRMHSLWLLTRPLQYLTLEDRVDLIYEPGLVTGDRTRGLATGATATIDSSGLSYLSTFNVLFVDAPEYAKLGAWVDVQFQLIEGVKTTP